MDTVFKPGLTRRGKCGRLGCSGVTARRVQTGPYSGRGRSPGFWTRRLRLRRTSPAQTGRIETVRTYGPAIEVERGPHGGIQGGTSLPTANAMCCSAARARVETVPVVSVNDLTTRNTPRPRRIPLPTSPLDRWSRHDYTSPVNRLTPNPKTGFLESINPLTPESFTSDKKEEFLRLAREAVDRGQYPPTAKLCDAIGIAHRTFNDHCKRDPVFFDAWSEIKARINSVFANMLSRKAEKNVIANLAILRYNESGSWNNQDRVILASDNATQKAISDRISTYLDAEIVEQRQIAPNNQPETQNNGTEPNESPGQ